MHDHAIIHGCLVAIDGVGVVIVGDAGVGKTTVCLELASLGHNFIADDAVEIQRISSVLVGSAPTETAGLLAIRGLEGLKPISRGDELSTSIDLVVELITRHETLPHFPLEEWPEAIPRMRLRVSESAAKEIELLAVETGRNSLPRVYGKQKKT